MYKRPCERETSTIIQGSHPLQMSPNILKSNIRNKNCFKQSIINYHLHAPKEKIKWGRKSNYLQNHTLAEDAQTCGYEYKNAQLTISYLFKISIIHALPAKQFQSLLLISTFQYMNKTYTIHCWSIQLPKSGRREKKVWIPKTTILIPDSYKIPQEINEA